MVRRYWLRIGIVLILAFVLLAIHASYKQFTRNERILREVDILRQEADKIRRENETLGEKVQYFSSDNFRELEAKEKLGMKKVGEEVVIIKSRPEATEEVVEKEKIDERLSDQKNLPNYQKWWNIFFRKVS